MGLMDQVAAEFARDSAGSPRPGVAGAVLEMLANQQSGGLPALVQAFHDKGLGGVVSSWVGTGQNQPITADEIRTVLTSDQIRQLAQRAGVSPDLAASTLASVLPQVVDKLTPNGTIEHTLLASGFSFLKDRFK
jgi:uncharacterized protein YidB (DUF937 family)